MAGGEHNLPGETPFKLVEVGALSNEQVCLNLLSRFECRHVKYALLSSRGFAALAICRCGAISLSNFRCVANQCTTGDLAFIVRRLHNRNVPVSRSWLADNDPARYIFHARSR